MSDKLTWEALREMEPALCGIHADIVAVEPAWVQYLGEAYCANDAWYGARPQAGYKKRLVALIGWNRSAGRKDAPELMTVEAYDTAYKHLYGLLPPCGSQCGCM